MVAVGLDFPLFRNGSSISPKYVCSVLVFVFFFFFLFFRRRCCRSLRIDIVFGTAALMTMIFGRDSFTANY